MSSVAKGASRVHAVAESLGTLGFTVWPVSASGRRSGKTSEFKGAGDLIAGWPHDDARYPHLLLEVGGSGKRLRAAFAELRKALLPGMRPMVVRFTRYGGDGRIRRAIYTSEHDRHSGFGDALMALREEK